MEYQIRRILSNSNLINWQIKNHLFSEGGERKEILNMNKSIIPQKQLRNNTKVMIYAYSGKVSGLRENLRKESELDIFQLLELVAAVTHEI